MAISEGRIKREEFAHYLNCTPGGGTATYERLGSGMDSMSRARNMEVNAVRDITGDTEITVTKGNETVDVSPYYAKRGTKLYEFISGLDDSDAELDETLTDYVEVKAWTEGGVVLNKAAKRECYIEVAEVGGDTTGLVLNFNVHLRGAKVLGTWDPTTKTFTPATS